uniref:Uncharacterized protein n=1 Tax=Caenorhabditis japonica TaxID=281687 RepID=A0A8R1HIN4_CAEJA
MPCIKIKRLLQQKYSSGQISAEAGISQQTVCDWRNFLKELLRSYHCFKRRSKRIILSIRMNGKVTVCSKKFVVRENEKDEFYKKVLEKLQVIL